jgi:hypothetical protein
MSSNDFLENLNMLQIDEIDREFREQHKEHFDVFNALNDEYNDIFDDFFQSLNIPFVEREREQFFFYRDSVMDEYNDIVYIHKVLSALFKHPLWKVVMKIKNS